MKKIIIPVIVVFALTACTQPAETKTAPDLEIETPEPVKAASTIDAPNTLKATLTEDDILYPKLTVAQFEEIPAIYPIDHSGVIRYDLRNGLDRWKEYKPITEILKPKEAQNLVDKATEGIPLMIEGSPEGLNNYEFRYYNLKQFPAHMVLVPPKTSAKDIRDTLLPAWRFYLRKRIQAATLRAKKPGAIPLKEHMDIIKKVWKPDKNMVNELDKAQEEVEGGSISYEVSYENESGFSSVNMGALVPTLTPKTSWPDFCGKADLHTSMQTDTPTGCKFLRTNLYANTPTVLKLGEHGVVDIGTDMRNSWEFQDEGTVESNNRNGRVATLFSDGRGSFRLASIMQSYDVLHDVPRLGIEGATERTVIRENEFY